MTIDDVEGLREYIETIASTDDEYISKINDMEFTVHGRDGVPTFVEGRLGDEPIRFMIHFSEHGTFMHSYLYFWSDCPQVYFFDDEGYKVAERHFDGLTGFSYEKVFDYEDTDMDCEDVYKSGVETYSFPWYETIRTVYVRVEGDGSSCTESCMKGVDDVLEDVEPEEAFPMVEKYRNMYEG